MSKGIDYLRRFAKITGVCLLIFVGAGIFSYFFVYVKTENLDEEFRWSDEQKERYFAESLPSRGDIEKYFSNATFFTSDPPIGNDITYFDNDGDFFDWHGNEIKKGHWSIYPIIYIRSYKSRRRVGIIYSRCIYLEDNSLTEDNCYLVGRKNIYQRSGDVERRSGDLFNLSKRQAAPFSLPTVPINIPQIEAALRQY
ncbi:MAG: hypothetical protein AB1508_13880 [Pseudomonadota bacterium]